MSEKALFNLDGNVATMTVYEDRAVITGKKGILGFMAGRAFDGSKRIYFQEFNIRSIWSFC